MKKNRNCIRVDFSRKDGTEARLYIPMEKGNNSPQAEQEGDRALQTILRQNDIKNIIEALTCPPTDEQYAEPKASFTQDEMANVARMLDGITDSLNEIRKALGLAIETNQLPF